MAVVLAVGGCAPSGPVRAALYGDLPSLREEIRRAERANKLDRAEVKRLALAVAEREAASANGSSGVRHVRSLSVCGSALLPALRRRSEHTDEVAAQAMRVRIALRDVSTASLVKDYTNAREGAWRAVAARAAVAAEDALQRRAWFTDPDQEVREAALEAAAIAPVLEDREALLEVFRLDPDPICRSRAAHAAGALGGEESVLGLADRFARADSDGQLNIVEAWAMPASYSSGGARELRRLASAGNGLPSIAAVEALLRQNDHDGALAGLLAMAIEHGSEEEQRTALQQAPVADERVRGAVERASRDANPNISVLAWSRLLEVPAHSAAATNALRIIAKKPIPAAAEARFTLASVGDASVVPELVAEAQSGAPWSRGRAAVALFRLGQPARAAATLADPDPGVRIATACGIVAAR
ncbi:MAG TPA: hypothetical protein VFQ35_17015 [Polyangiaceae bacterium]|nr:hypothetical protein [Polyangiaceae bacterium]